ncbi:MAG: PIN domain-containing protein [Chloroflexota bacterium]|nr:MAG: PIN domain-containing protein [Chloroflexota bacterium]
MVKFWDASALASLLVREAMTGILNEVAAADPAIAIWWGTPVECRSVLARREREGSLLTGNAVAAHRAFEALFSQAQEIPPSVIVRDRAIRLVDVHDLRAADALQLAAALVWTRERPAGSGFVCLDRRLRAAAGREGFDVLPALLSENAPCPLDAT